MERKPLRLPAFDYRQEAVYFVTVCTEEKIPILCSIKQISPYGEVSVELSEIGEKTEQAIRVIPGIDKYVIMPNHIHMIIFCKAGKSISQIIRIMKSIVTAKVGKPIWQRSFYEHVIRNEQDYLTRWKYMDDNPAKWASDEYYPTVP